MSKRTVPENRKSCFQMELKNQFYKQPFCITNPFLREKLPTLAQEGENTNHHQAKSETLRWFS